VRLETIRAVAALARRAPEEWASFLKELAIERDEVVAQCIASAITELPVQQGRARAIKTLVDDLAGAVKRADDSDRRKQ
jgi:hypothetical protein